MTSPEQLVAAYLDGELDPAECETFVQWLEADPRHVRLFVEHALWDHALHDAVVANESIRHAAARRADSAAPRLHPPHERGAAGKQPDVLRRKTVFGFPLWLPAAAVFALLLAVVALWRPWQLAGPHLVSVEGRVRIVRDGHELPGENGVRLRAGDVIATEARAGARIRFGREATWLEMVDQSELVLEAFAGAKEVRLRHGGFEAQVAPQPPGRPMICRTPLGRATVLGTRLSLSADRNISRLEVLKGAVTWDGETHGSTLEVKTGQFALADVEAGVRVDTLWGGARLEAESLMMDDARSGQPVRVSRHASGRRERVLRWRGSPAPRTIHVPVAAPGDYLLHAGVIRGNTAMFQFFVDGAPLGRAYDSFGQGAERSIEIALGVVRFDSAGSKPLQITLAGMNPAANSRTLRLDYLRLEPLRETLAPGWEPGARTFAVQSGAELALPLRALRADSPLPAVAAKEEAAEGRVTVLGDPAHGRLQRSPRGGFTYTPDAGFSGEDRFVYHLGNGQRRSQPVTATIDVRPVHSQMDVAWTPAAPALDGRLDAVWSHAAPQPIARVLEGRTDSADDFSATLRALWDERCLYLFVEVRDDHKRPGVKALEPWHRDAVEIYLDGPNRKRPRWNDELGFRAAWGIEHLETIRRAAPLGRISIAQADAAHGYTVELAIPWESAGRADVAPETLVGLEVHVLDDDNGGERDTVLGWFNTRDLAHIIPATFGTIRLVKPAAPLP